MPRRGGIGARGHPGDAEWGSDSDHGAPDRAKQLPSTSQINTPAGSKPCRYAPKDVCSSIEIVLCQERDQLPAGRLLPDRDELRQDALSGAQGFRLIAIDE